MDAACMAISIAFAQYPTEAPDMSSEDLTRWVNRVQPVIDELTEVAARTRATDELAGQIFTESAEAFAAVVDQGKVVADDPTPEAREQFDQAALDASTSVRDIESVCVN